MFLSLFQYLLNSCHVCQLQTCATNTETLCCCKFPELDSCSYGVPGVEFTGLHKDTTAVTQIHFLPGQVSFMSPNGLEMAKHQTDVIACAIWERAACCRCWMTTRFICGSW